MGSAERGDIVVAVSDGVLLDVAGPVQVLHWAGHRIRFASPDGRAVCTDVGAPLGRATPAPNWRAHLPNIWWCSCADPVSNPSSASATASERRPPPDCVEGGDTVVADPGGRPQSGAMAERAALSERHLTRLFTKEIGISPGRYVEQVRVAAAQALLESSTDGVATIARHCGFGSEETMRRIFSKLLGITPTDIDTAFTRCSEIFSNSALHE
ncbi:helix-turn-helix domain-containing protein [Nocardia sp. CA-084685]|uniref:helix-turn-helix domain-containing protein n=1 Tax=Nocardia sp. CA-084685 TaxID=3239970 RepID=UPI003D9952A8